MTTWDVRYVVDGMNVIGSRPDGWWRDRPRARRVLVDELAPLAATEDVTVVFDGRPDPGEIDDAARVGVAARFAPGGPNAADDAIVELVKAEVAPETLVVVTSDATLARRVSQYGTEVLGVRSFRDRLDS